MTIEAGIQFARQERLRFVESVVLWEGLVKRQRVREVFGVTLNHVTRDLSYYLQQHPDSLDFRPELRGYIAGPRFKPVYASDAPAEYLSLLQTRAETGTAIVLPLVGGHDLDVGALPSPALGIHKGVLRHVCHAIRQQRGVKAIYHAMNADRSRERTFWPHALVNTGLRWYVRVYDGESGSFRSLVLARMERSTKVDTPSPVRSALDAAWTTQVVAEVIPHPKLNPHQQVVVAREFGMQREGDTWLWSVSLRQCLVGPFARRYGLDTAPTAKTAASQWVVLRNYAQLKAHFWPESSD
jgi:hypothetical protein